MTPEQLKQAAAVMIAASEGKPIECRSEVGGGWHSLRHSSPPALRWDWYEYEYRVASTKPSINWEHVHPDVVAIATNKNGFTLAFYAMPKIQGEWWETEFSEPMSLVNAFASFVTGTCDWTESLVVRPVVE